MTIELKASAFPTADQAEIDRLAAAGGERARSRGAQEIDRHISRISMLPVEKQRNMTKYAWGVPNGDTQMTTKTKNANRRLTPGTLVVSYADGEPGRIVGVCTFRRNGLDAWSYLVQTAAGREIWEVGELFVPQA